MSNETVETSEQTPGFFRRHWVHGLIAATGIAVGGASGFAIGRWTAGRKSDPVSQDAVNAPV
jgi:membrane protein YqaA with SNARE-associated domain